MGNGVLAIFLCAFLKVLGSYHNCNIHHGTLNAEAQNSEETKKSVKILKKIIKECFKKFANLNDAKEYLENLKNMLENFKIMQEQLDQDDKKLYKKLFCILDKAIAKCN